jgi:hypothetical protein
MAGTKASKLAPTDVPPPEAEKSADAGASARPPGFEVTDVDYPRLHTAVTYTLTEADAQAINARRSAYARFLRNVDPSTGGLGGVAGGQSFAAMVVAENGGTPGLTCFLPGGDVWAVASAPEAPEVGTEGTWVRLVPLAAPEGAES